MKLKAGFIHSYAVVRIKWPTHVKYLEEQMEHRKRSVNFPLKSRACGKLFFRQWRQHLIPTLSHLKTRYPNTNQIDGKCFKREVYRKQLVIMTQSGASSMGWCGFAIS